MNYDNLSSDDKFKINRKLFEIIDYSFDVKGNIVATIKLRN